MPKGTQLAHKIRLESRLSMNWLMLFPWQWAPFTSTTRKYPLPLAQFRDIVFTSSELSLWLIRIQCSTTLKSPAKIHCSMSQHAWGLLGDQLKEKLLSQLSSLCLGTHKMEIALLGEEQEDKMRWKGTMFKMDKRRYFFPHYTQLTWELTAAGY